MSLLILFLIFVFQEPSEDLISQELTNPPEAIREEVVETEPNPVVVVADDHDDDSSSTSPPLSSSSSSSGSDSEHSEIVPNNPAESGPDHSEEKSGSSTGTGNQNIISESFAADEEVPDSQVEEEISSNQIAS